MEYRINVRCDDETTGNTGTFIAGAGTHKAVTPIFLDLAELFPWMRLNGWKSEEYKGNLFIPWRVVSIIKESL
jgi:hypothetical protein